ncbi:MAG: CidA/LrgA family protein [Lachnospiraceae bacterium]
MHRKILLQISMIMAICLVAEALVSVLPFAFPSSVAAILILALLLGLRVIKEKQIQETADFMLSCMALVFVPLTVGVIEDLELLKGQVAGFLVVVFVSLILTFLGTYASVRIVQMITGRTTSKGDEKDLPQKEEGGQIHE